MKPKVFGGAFTWTITLIALYVGIMDKQVWPEEVVRLRIVISSNYYFDCFICIYYR